MNCNKCGEYIKSTAGCACSRYNKYWGNTGINSTQHQDELEKLRAENAKLRQENIKLAGKAEVQHEALVRLWTEPRNGLAFTATRTDTPTPHQKLVQAALELARHEASDHHPLGLGGRRSESLRLINAFIAAEKEAAPQ